MPPRKKQESSWLSTAIATTLIGLLGTLIATGIVSMISLYSRVSTLTEDVHRTEAALARHLDHSVDRDEWLRRDQQVQKAIDNMATKDDLKQLRMLILDIVSDSNPRAAATRYR